jgi:hypothetical protein
VRLAALTAAVLAAVVVPGAPPGVGLVVVAVLVAVTGASEARRTPDLFVFGSAALALASFAAVLDARWVVRIDLVAAWLFAAIALGGAHLRAVVAPIGALRALPTLAPSSASRLTPAFRGAAIGTFVAIPFAALFLTADAAFAALADDTPHPSLGSLPGRTIAFAVVLLASLGLALAARRRSEHVTRLRSGGLPPAEWAVPLALLDALFLAFVTVQITVLFGGHDHVLRTAGLTYAEYARQGFWQLTAAAVLTLVVVKTASVVAETRTDGERRLLRALLALLCLLTLVIVASAFHRLRLYEAAFGLTRPRLAAEAFILWLGGAFVLVLLAGAFRRAAPMRGLLASVAVGLVLFSAADPDARIADRNVERWRETGRIDVGYLATLSADSVPALIELPPRLRERALAGVAARLEDREPLTSANLSRRRARELLGVRPDELEHPAPGVVRGVGELVLLPVEEAVRSTRVRDELVLDARGG